MRTFFINPLIWFDNFYYRIINEICPLFCSYLKMLGFYFFNKFIYLFATINYMLNKVSFYVKIFKGMLLNMEFNT